MRLDGKKITRVVPHYEQIAVYFDDGTRCFMKYDDLLPVLTEFLFDAEKKRTRTWLHPVTPDVDLLYLQKSYPNYGDHPI